MTAGGVTPEEVARAYPCDDLVTNPAFQGWRGVTVARRQLLNLAALAERAAGSDRR